MRRHEIRDSKTKCHAFLQTKQITYINLPWNTTAIYQQEIIQKLISKKGAATNISS